MSFPYFSVIIPAFNRDATIRETLQSVELQTFRDFEVIVVDDGSSDSTCEIVQSFSFVKLIKQTNAGPGAARNFGAAIASGVYLSFLDSDDLWLPWTLSRYADAITQYKNPAMVTGKPMLFESVEHLTDCCDTTTHFEFFKDYYASGDQWRWYGVSSFVIRRDSFQRVGGFASAKINGEDADLAMRLGIAPGFVHVKSPVQFGYRVHEGNVTNDTTKSQAGLEFLLSNEAKGIYPGGHQRTCDRARIIARHVRPFAVNLAKSGQGLTALRFYRAVLGEALQNHRWKFLLGLPILAIWGMMRRLVRSVRVSFGC